IEDRLLPGGSDFDDRTLPVGSRRRRAVAHVGTVKIAVAGLHKVGRNKGNRSWSLRRPEDYFLTGGCRTENGSPGRSIQLPVASEDDAAGKFLRKRKRLECGEHVG